MTRDELIKHLQDNYSADESICVHLWTREDVYEVAESEDIEIDDGIADSVLERVENNLDSSMGVSWETIRQALLDEV